MLVHQLREHWDPEYPGAWGEWPPEYLQGLLTIARYQMRLMDLWKWEARTTADVSGLKEATGKVDPVKEAVKSRAGQNFYMMYGGKG